MNLSLFILGAIPLLIQYYADKYQKNDLDSTLQNLEGDLNLPRIKTYDFIVVGAGTAGCLLAARLSEHFNVLLLESGGNPVPVTQVPFMSGAVFSHPAINNVFTSIPQTNYAQEENDGIDTVYTGRMMGGSGSHNGNFFNRGSPSIYDHWASITGDESWSYKNVLHHFKNIENFRGKLVNESERNEYYGTSGKIDVQTDWPPFLPAWFAAAKELGYQVGDPNGFQRESFTSAAKSIQNGERASTYTEFVKPIKDSPNSKLTVLRYSMAEQILFNENKGAFGVAYKRHEIPQIAHASKEVIISCGAVQSPLLLIKSGIGPKTTLRDARISPISVLEGVGKNLRDHGAVAFSVAAGNPNRELFPEVDDIQESVEVEIKKYQHLKRSGIFTRRDLSAQAFIISENNAGEIGSVGNCPNLHIIFAHRAAIGPTQLSLQVILSQPRSVGEIGFNSSAFVQGETNDVNLALIDHNLFSDAADVDALLYGIQLAFKIMEETTSFKNMNITTTNTIPTACQDITFRSDDYWRCYIRQRGQSYMHLGGTCKMGKTNDHMSVVDSKLRVHGVSKLRVVDASVFPRVINANTNAGVMLVAEKASTDILAHYKTKHAVY